MAKKTIKKVDRTTLLSLTVFLGGFGAHRFYLKQHVLGIVYLIFCWTYIPALIALVEFLVMIFMNEKDFNKKFN